MHKCYEAGPQEAGQRLDRYLAEQEPEISRSYLQKLIREGCVLADGNPRGWWSILPRGITQERW